MFTTRNMCSKSEGGVEKRAEIETASHDTSQGLQSALTSMPLNSEEKIMSCYEDSCDLDLVQAYDGGCQS
eukprot:753837-Hanusia_phi.AAC.8